jgi:hypothetical protein
MKRALLEPSHVCGAVTDEKKSIDNRTFVNKFQNKRAEELENTNESGVRNRHELFRVERTSLGKGKLKPDLHKGSQLRGASRGRDDAFSLSS